MIESLLPKGSSRFWTAILSILLAFLIGAVMIFINGDNPIVAYATMIQRSLGSISSLAATLAVATPLIFTGLSVAVAFRTGLDNIGSEGQLYMGAMAGALVGIYVKGLPAIIHIPLSILAGAIAGGIWGWIFGWLKVKLKVDLVVTTIMANYLAILFTSYLANYPFKPPQAPIGSTTFVEASARLKHFFEFSSLNIGIIIALAMLVLYWIFFSLTKTGFEWKTIGLNRFFARYIGMDINRQMLWAMFASGGFAGIAGTVEVLGVQGRFVQNMSPGYGYDGILVALLAGNSAPGILAVAILFGALRIGGIGVEQVTNVPSELSQVLRAIIILLVAAQIGIFSFIKARRKKHHELGSSIQS
jgi:ABC-type uncharacterized transport system permease subunit